MHIDNRTSISRLNCLLAKKRLLLKIEIKHNRSEKELQHLNKEIAFIQQYRENEKCTKELASIVGIEYYD